MSWYGVTRRENNAWGAFNMTQCESKVRGATPGCGQLPMPTRSAVYSAQSRSTHQAKHTLHASQRPQQAFAPLSRHRCTPQAQVAFCRTNGPAQARAHHRGRRCVGESLCACSSDACAVPCWKGQLWGDLPSSQRSFPACIHDAAAAQARSAMRCAPW